MPKLSEKLETHVKTRDKKKNTTKNTPARRGLEIKRYFTKDGIDPLDEITYELRSSKIVNPDGRVVFEAKDIEVPKFWSRVATDILISKYLRKSGVPQYDKSGKLVKDKEGKPHLGGENSVRQIVKRLAGCWRWWGEKYGYFASKSDAKNFEEELKFMLANQYGAPNSPQWFNTGLALFYNITGKPQGHWYADPKTGTLKQSEDAYTHPQPHACFIQSVKDDLVNEGGIFDLVTKEARIFKYGSGSGSNFSILRGEGEPLSGGGTSSGLMSWLYIFDRSAGAIKSGGTTRRAAKMVILNIDHPDIEKFIDWKFREEQKAAALIAAGYDGNFEGEAFQTVSGQNSNNSVRVDDEFMTAVETDSDWHLRWRTDPEHISKTLKAKYLWDKIANAAWHCADPGLQFDSNVNSWNTCLSSGRINGSNPCSEFMFLDDSSCNLASLNLLRFYNTKEKKFDIESFQHAARLWTVVLEISVLMAQFPSYEIAKNSYLYRPLGLGYANLGALLMVMGLPYDSDEGRDVAACITAIMTGEAYATSAEMAKALGTFKEYPKNKEDMLRVIRNHRRAVFGAEDTEFEALNIKPYRLDEKKCDHELLQAARTAWDKALLEGGQYGYRNAQVTLLAPTGTIGLTMDCDTTGIEPDYSLVKFKKLAGGGFFKIINQSVPFALESLNYSKEETKEIITYVIGTGSLENAPHINFSSLKKKGFDDEMIKKIEKTLPGVFDLNQAFNKEVLGEQAMQKLGLKKEKYEDPMFNLLGTLEFSADQIEEAKNHICGMMTIEDAPHLHDEHLPIFDCANKCGAYGKRYIEPAGHIKMMSAAQPYLSGAISKTVNIPNEAKAEDIEKIYFDSWKMGLKAIAIYRDGSKLAQPLSSQEDKKKETEEKEVIIQYKPLRRKLPKERMSITRKVRIGGHKLYLTVGLYDDGTPGEIFITMSQQGTFTAGMIDSFAKILSIGLQYGVPIQTIVQQLRHMRFQPMGYTGDQDISNVSSISDFIAQWLDKKFLQGGVKTMMLPFNEKQAAKDNSDDKAGNQQEEIEQGQLEGIGLVEDDLDTQTKELGFTGDMCVECGSAMMVQNGKCLKCVNCGATTGCS